MKFHVWVEEIVKIYFRVWPSQKLKLTAGSVRDPVVVDRVTKETDPEAVSIIHPETQEL